MRIKTKDNSEMTGKYVTTGAADDDLIAIFNSREKSPETTELVRRRIELARHGATRPQWNRGLGRKIYVPRIPEEDKRREIKRNDIQLKRKQEQSLIGGG